MYQKPVLYKTEDLTEGVYAASGSSQNAASFTSGGFKPYWSGNPNDGIIEYAVTIPANYSGKSVVLTLNFSKAISNLYGMGGSQSVQGTTGKLSLYSAQSGTITVQSSNGDPGLKSISIASA